MFLMIFNVSQNDSQAKAPKLEYAFPEFDDFFADSLNSCIIAHESSDRKSCLDDVPTCIRGKRNRPPSEANHRPTHVEWFVDKRRKLLSCPTAPHHRGRPPE